jgi:tRNA-specific 2-thiouridylase
MDQNLTGMEWLAPGARVAVAMSGGVDSSLTAAMLAAAGFDVVGVTLQLYDHGRATSRKGACCAGEDIHDARKVAAQLGIAHYVLDFEARFRDAVMADFAESYAAGRTPVPCVRCNQRIKFSDLLAIARDLGAAALATGHYARRIMGPAGPELHMAAEAARDQSYFLFATRTEELDFLRFPLGHLTKGQVRAAALAAGLAVAEKPDSQDICFVPEGRYAAIVEKLRPGAAEPGAIVDLEGRVLGEHPGIIHFTVGQRRGLSLGGGPPHFVLALDGARREVVVGPRAALLCRRFSLTEVNLLADPGFAVTACREPVPARVKVRSTRAPRPALLRLLEGGQAEVTIAEGEEGVAPGQACVFYAPQETGEGAGRVLGGGFIDKTERTAGSTERLEAMPAPA